MSSDDDNQYFTQDTEETEPYDVSSDDDNQKDKDLQDTEETEPYDVSSDDDDDDNNKHDDL